ncbi:MAG: histidinol-phosphatase [Chitinivibrionales bacterium]|nr:histidinol-phosphatase [Chitinivibrionales bacterium]
MLVDELRVARELCARAARVQLESRPSPETIAAKPDGSPVTDVDRRCEEIIVEGIERVFPDDGILGEETGEHAGQSGRQWVVDPLDGTRPYIRGIPTYSVLLALEDHGEPVVGVVHLPALGIECWASRGSGAFLNGERTRVSATTELGDAIGSALGFIERADEPIAGRLLAMMRRWGYVYGFMDAYSYVAVASGKLDLCVNLLDKSWDCAAGACIVSEAGGRFSDIEGRASTHNGTIVLSNGLLHETVLRSFA